MLMLELYEKNGRVFLGTFGCVLIRSFLCIVITNNPFYTTS